jgi:hypothetical protein
MDDPELKVSPALSNDGDRLPVNCKFKYDLLYENNISEIVFCVIFSSPKTNIVDSNALSVRKTSANGFDESFDLSSIFAPVIILLPEVIIKDSASLISKSIEKIDDVVGVTING